MEFTCSLLNIKLTEILRVKFCTNYVKFFSHCSQISSNNSISHSATYWHVQTHRHTHTQEQNGTCLQGNIFSVSYPVSLLAYSAPVTSSRKFPHTQLHLYRYSNKICCTVPCMTFIDVLQYVTFFTPLHFCTPLLYLNACSPDPSPHTPVQSRTVQWPTATAQHCQDLLYRYVP